MPAIISKEELVEFLNFVRKPGTSAVAVGDINDTLYYGTNDALVRKTGSSWDITERQLLLNGQGDKVIYVPYVPINDLVSLTIRKKNTETVDITLTGSERQVWWDSETGRIEMIAHVDDLGGLLSVEPSEFPKGMENVAVVGSFGTTPPNLAKYVYCLMYLKQLTISDKARFGLDMVMERIGRYEYRIGVPSNQAVPNQYKGIDGLIEWYLQELIEDKMVLDV